VSAAGGKITGMSFLLRVHVPDRPGSLGALATALASVGADILSVDVVERGNGTAVDDLVVDLPRGALPDALITAAEALDGVRVDSVRPYTGVLDTHRELELIDHVAATIGDRLQVLVDGLPRVLRVGWATVIHSGSAGRLPRGGQPRRPGDQGRRRSVAATGGTHRTRRHRRLGACVVARVDTTLAAAPLGSGEQALLIGRPGGPEFRPSEVARLGHMAGIVATVLR